MPISVSCDITMTKTKKHSFFSFITQFELTTKKLFHFGETFSSVTRLCKRYVTKRILTLFILWGCNVTVAFTPESWAQWTAHGWKANTSQKLVGTNSNHVRLFFHSNDHTEMIQIMQTLLLKWLYTRLNFNYRHSLKENYISSIPVILVACQLLFFF